MQETAAAHYHTAWTLGVIRSGLVAIAVVCSAPFVAESMHEPRVVSILWTLAAATVIGSFESIRLVDFQINMNFSGVFRHHRRLDDLVLDGGDAERPLSATHLRYVSPAGWQRSIRPCVYPYVEILEVTLEAFPRIGPTSHHPRPAQPASSD
jgi:hypothetical protein